MRRALFLALVLGCSSVDASARRSVVGPDRSSFPPVSTWMEHRCGSLDCHGSRYRNLRIWGHDGLRLAVGDVPGGSATTASELDATYQSIVELEPELMGEVVAAHGERPERLTLVRKARGDEKHAGGKVVTAGDPRDRCITSWLSGATDAASCDAALTLP